MSSSLLKKFTRSNLFLFGLFGVIACSLFVMQSISSSSTTFSKYYFYLLIFNVTLAIVLLLVILSNLISLIRQVSNKVSGSRLQLRLSGILISVTIIPLVIFFFFALNIINQGIDDWFDVRVDQVMEDSLKLSNTIINIEFNNRLRQVNQVGRFLSENESSDILATVLERQRNQIQATEIALFNNEKGLIASANPGIGFIPSVPESSVFDYVKSGNPIVNSTIVNEEKVIQVLIKLSINRPIFLYAIFPISDDILKLSENITKASNQYQQLISLRKPLQESLSINLLLGLLLALLSAIVVALRLTERFIEPITQLANATNQISEGDFDVKLDDAQNDDLGFLVGAFKIMANKIKTSNHQITASKSLIEERNDYLQDLLANMSSGVLCINTKLILVDYNQAAEEILGIDFSSFENQSVKDIAKNHTKLQKLLSLVKEEQSQKSRQIEIKSEHGSQSSKVLICKIKDQIQYGKKVYLIIFDDVTELLEAQRDSAWSEVAKRMAHEIKNPLTPIQLSAERISRKYSQVLNEEDRISLNSMTTTINKQVHTIKKMVEAFIQYGKNPQLTIKQVDINQLIIEVGNLYTNDKDIQIEYQLQENCKVIGDEDRLRQLFNNLIKNSIEAINNLIKSNPKHKGVLTLTTHFDRNNACVIFKDNGGGIDFEILDKIFVPYVSSKPKGTGLGMAIVKKIVEEHDAKIFIKNLEDSNHNKLGAMISIEFPVNKSNLIEI